MKNSIIQKNKKCYVCGTTQNIHLHHVIFGKNRNNSDKDGLMVYLCYEHHEGKNGVHGKNGHELDYALKRKAEIMWCEYYNKTPDDFLKRYKRNYL